MKATIIPISLLLSFSLTHCMNETEQTNNIINDAGLQQIIKHVNNSSLSIVNIVKKHAQQKNKSLTSENIKSLLLLEPKDINAIFLANVENDNIRQLMLSIGADINTCDNNGSNCLWYTQKPELLNQLIDNGADVNTLSHNKNTCLNNLLYFPDEQSLPAIKVLLEKNANPNIKMCPYTSPLHRIVQDSKNKVSFEVAELLCKYKAHINIQNDLGETPLTIGISQGSIAFVKLFLEHGGKADEPNKFNEYPLHLAIPEHAHHNSHIIPTIVTLLLQYGANPNRPYRAGKCMPLHVAIKNHLYDIIQILVNGGAELHHCNIHGYTPYQLAQQNKYPSDILALLRTTNTLTDSPKKHTPEIYNDVFELAIANEDDSQEEASTCFLQ